MNPKLLLLFLIIIKIGFSQEQYKYFAKEDLNADKIVDEINLKSIDGTYTLSINEVFVEIEFEADYIYGFKIIDIDKNDSYKEIYIVAEGPGGGTISKIYWFDGKQIHFMNTLSYPKFSGNGFVYDDIWEDFWNKREKYKLQKETHKLTIVPQFAYYVGVKDIVVKNWITIYSDKKMTEKLATLSKNSKIEILLCDTKNSDNENDFIYLIKSTTNLIGWIKADILKKSCTGFNFAG